ncbi:uncharacterized protein LOC119860659 [Dermochelys coriacea]|uniref:uncharacterized protein LOC119860659 n=1 Tax=Dermochelys coriacea TaxID=27794 RepID=UPI0018E8ED4C|nr:uncharacterized protein LOC119860659 [Dermochelys coriacea]XP_043347440.1 uncharacterized protein LOC119860659 [Dermochelys coriacea]
MLLSAKRPLHLGMIPRLIISISLLLMLLFHLDSRRKGQGEVLVTSPLSTDRPTAPLNFARRIKAFQSDVLVTSPLYNAKPRLFQERRRNTRSAETTKIQGFLTTKDIENWPWWQRRSIVHWQGGSCGMYSWECGVKWWGGFIPGAGICAYGQIPAECTALPNWLPDDEYQKRLTATNITPTIPSTFATTPVSYPNTDDTVYSNETYWPRPSHLSDVLKFCSENLFFKVHNSSYERTIEWKTNGSVEIEIYDITTDEPRESEIAISGFYSEVDMMVVPGVCKLLDERGPHCYLVTQLVNNQTYTQRVCSVTGNFTCTEMIPVTNNLTCTILQYTPSYAIDANASQKYIKVFSQQMWYSTVPERDVVGYRWTVINTTLGTIKFTLPLSSFQITSTYPNCSRGAAIRLAQQRAWVSSRKKRDLDGSLWDGANSAAAIWNIYRNQEHEEKLGQLEKATGLITGAQLTQVQAGVGELRVISALSSMTQKLLTEMVLNITEAGKALQWDLACSEIQDFLNDQLMAIRSDLEHQAWPTALTDTSGVSSDLWPWRHTWRFSGWRCRRSQCSFQAYGPVGGMWAPTYRILPGPWGGCMWDWVIHRDIWELRLPGMPNRFLVSAPRITPDIWIGIGSQWTFWPLEPPQLQCVRKLKPGEVVTVHDNVCWEGIGQGTTLTGHLLFQANDSCVHVEATMLQDIHFNLTTAAGNHIIYWPADRILQSALRFQIPLNWTTLVPDRFQNLLSILPEIQKITELQGQLHMLQNIYQVEKYAFHTAYRVSTLCTKYDVLCFVTKTVQQPHHIITMGMLLLVLLLFGLGLCYCCYKGRNNNNTLHVHTNHALSLYPIKTPKVEVFDEEFEIQNLMKMEI